MHDNFPKKARRNEFPITFCDLGTLCGRPASTVPSQSRIESLSSFVQRFLFALLKSFVSLQICIFRRLFALSLSARFALHRGNRP